jgi:hypothetical protein
MHDISRFQSFFLDLPAKFRSKIDCLTGLHRVDRTNPSPLLANLACLACLPQDTHLVVLGLFLAGVTAPIADTLDVQGQAEAAPFPPGFEGSLGASHRPGRLRPELVFLSGWSGINDRFTCSSHTFQVPCL